MNKRDVIFRLLDESCPVEVTPAAFFLHFDPAYHRGQPAVDKHLDFFRSTGMDFVKIQYEHAFPRLDAIQRPEDWEKMPFYELDFYEQPLRVVEGLVKAAKAEAPVVLTLYSAFMLAGQVTSGEMITRHIHENPQAAKRGIEIIAQSLLEFVREAIRLGLDGFYMSTQGGEAGRFADRSLFDTCIRPYDLMIMEEIQRSCPFNILHICDYHLPYEDLAPYVDYPGHVINASLELTGGNISAREVASMFNRPFMGGMNRKGTLASGNEEEVRQVAQQALESAPERFILAADCTVPGNTPWSNLRAAIDTAHSYRRGSLARQ